MNNQEIKYAQPGATLNDDVVKGLALRCLATKKTFYVFYRIHGQQRRPKVGDWPTISLSQARDLAREMLLQVARGIDPSAKRQEERDAPNMAELFAKHLDANGHKKTLGQDKWMWGKFIQPLLAKRRVLDMDLSDILMIHGALKDTPYQANRCLALLSTMLNRAEALGWRPNGSNPCRHVRRYKESKRRRYMTGDEAARIAALLDQNKDAHPASVAFIYLLIMTGARKSEIANARWDQLQGNKIVLTVHKTDGNGQLRTIHLPDVVMDTLAKLPRTNGSITGIDDPKTFWNRIRKEAGCEDLRLHDLRHSFASAALSAGLTLGQIGELLGHRDAATTQRYAHLIDEAAQVAANKTADVLTGMMGR